VENMENTIRTLKEIILVLRDDIQSLKDLHNIYFLKVESLEKKLKRVDATMKKQVEMINTRVGKLEKSQGD